MRAALDLRSSLARAVDMRRGEGPQLARAGAALFLIVAAHSMLETARDALLLTRIPARDFGLVYVAVGLAVLPIAAGMARLAPRLGTRAALVAGLIAAAVALCALFAVDVSTGAVLGIYVVSTVLGAVLIPLFFSLLGSVFTLAQGRRLLGPVSAAGTLGAVIGSGAAAALVGFVSVTGLVLVSAVVGLLAAAVLPSSSPARHASAVQRDLDAAAPAATSDAPSADPFLRRMALLVAASTAALVVLDFTFKWTVSREVPPEDVAAFVARYYAILHGATLIAQLAMSRPLVRRLGVARAVLVAPLVIAAGAASALLAGAGAVLAVVALRALDTTLRASVYRMSTELAYLPLPAAIRERSKPLIDGALARAMQGVVGAALLAIGGSGYLSATVLLSLTLGTAALWMVAAWTFQTPYLALLRRSVAGIVHGAGSQADPLDFESAEALVGHLSAGEPQIVIGAMNALARRGRSRLIPALILLHEEETVLARALAIFGAEGRADWVARGRTLLRDRRDTIRTAAARALAAQGQLEASDLSTDANPRLAGYATLHCALRGAHADLALEPRVAAILEREGGAGEDARLGLLSGIADAPQNDRLRHLLEALAPRSWPTSEATVELARAAASQRAVRLIPALISRLTVREGREAVRTALLSFGADALQALRDVLGNPESPRTLRMHVPNTLARFGSDRAAELLLATIETDPDGFVRYKALRALGRLVAERRVKLDRARVERLALRNLLEHFRLIGLRARLHPAPREATERILVGMLDDKLRQSLERTFRLLKIAHPHEDLHRVHAAYVGGDRRASAVEFLDALLRPCGEATLGQLLRIAVEEATLDEVIEQARALLTEPPPATREQALELLLRDGDRTVASLAELHITAAAGGAQRAQPSSDNRPRAARLALSEAHEEASRPWLTLT